MACFIESIAVAGAVGIYRKRVASKEAREKSAGNASVARKARIPLSKKLGWYMQLLLGGSFLLAFEHAWHGEIVPYPPFLSALEVSGGFYTMLEEIALVGTLQVALITAVWGAMVFIAERLAAQDSELVRAK